MKTKSNTSKKLTAGIATLVILLVCLCVTTYALVMVSVSVSGNYFQTGTVKINLNNSQPIISEHEFLFEPGMTVKKDFFVENMSTDSVYYRLYFEDISGGLADILEITITDGHNQDKVLYSGLITELTRDLVGAADDTLLLAERRDLSIYFHFPRGSGNDAQNLTLSFDMCAEAVQTRNNTAKTFG